MGLPNVIIEFKTKATTAVKRGDRGIVGVVVKDSDIGVYKMQDSTGIPKNLTKENKAYIEKAFIGGVKPIKELVLIVTDTVANALDALETNKIDYIVGPPDIESADINALTNHVKALRDNKNIKVKAVLPNSKANHEGVINFTTDQIEVGDVTYTTAEYCSRIAGLLAGTPLQMSATYHVLTEVTNVPKFTKNELDTKINKGEFILFHDGEKVKVGRGINSLTTTSVLKGEDYKSIKIIDTMDLIYTDIKRTCEDNYVGKFPNHYGSKCNLIVAVQGYLEKLRDDGLLESNILTQINMQAQRNYLKSKGLDVDNMTVLELKKANTGTNVFIESNFKILNAIEDVNVAFNI